MSRLFLIPVALAVFGSAECIAQSATNFPVTAIARLADKKATDRSRISEEIARFASSTSGRTHLQRHVKDLVPFLKDEDDIVRYWVAMTLGHIGTSAKEAVPALIVALNERADTIASKSSVSGIRFVLDRIDSSWRSRPEVLERVK